MKRDLKEQIIEEIDIVDYISEVVSLRRRGANYVGLCPFHQEKTPSFTVSSEKKIFKCFGCGKSGNVITFAVEYYGLSFAEAIKELAKRAGLRYEQITDKTREELSKRDKIYQALEYAKKYYQKVLYTQSGLPALQYLASRGYNRSTISEFEIGYAPPAWDNLLRELTSAGFPKEILLEAGLIKQKEGHTDEYYDVFRDRVIFPIYNTMGKVVGFGGRTLKDSENQPKYLNTQQTDVFDKSKLLFGLFKGRNEIRSKESVILVEGYADVIALHQAGFKNAIASCGTSLTEEQLHQIARFCKTIYIAYDGDEAGQKATERALQLALPLGFEVLIIKLIEGEDPDSIVKKYGAKAFHNLLDNAMNFLEYLYHLAQARAILGRPAKKSKFIQYCLNLISTIPDRLQHMEYIQTLAELLALPYSQLETLFKEKSKLEYEKLSTEKRTITIEIPTTTSSQDLFPEEEQLISLCLDSVKSFEYLQSLHKFDSSQMLSEKGTMLFRILETHKSPDTLNSILNDLEINQETKDFFLNLVFSKEKLSENWEKYGISIQEKDYQKLLEDLLIKFQIRKIDLSVAEIRKQIVHNPENQDMLLKKIQEQLIKKQKLLNKIKK